MQETIFAVSSGSLPSGVAVVRVSGPAVSDIMETILRRRPRERQAELMSIQDVSGSLIDQGLVLFFPGPHSFTGEDCLELQVHGSRAVIAALYATLAIFPGTRIAEAGEFTRRAFSNGKIDLVEAEGLADLLLAETEMQRKLALEQAHGSHSTLYNGWASRITHARAMIEAELDFADEDDIPGSVAASIWMDMASLAAEIDEHLAGAQMAEIIRDGLKVVIYGAPNVGKSSIINMLSKRELAIVTDIPGTTRDIVSIDLDIDGYAVRLLDTAGIRDTDERVEREGIKRAVRAAEEADLVLHVIDLLRPETGSLAPKGRKTIRVGNKSDLVPDQQVFDCDVVMSVTSGHGIDQLMGLIRTHLKDLSGSNSLAMPARLRHVELLTATRDSLNAAIKGYDSGLDVRAEDLRRAANSLGRITGRVDVEDLLSVIFSEFCIGK